MNTRYVPAIALLSLSLGCAPRGPHASRDNAAERSDAKATVRNSASLEQARRLESSGRLRDAIIAYRLVHRQPQSSTDDKGLATLGVARCLLALGRHAAALNALAPLPEAPSTDLGRRKLAVAGEILLRRGQHGPAESALEVALSGLDIEESTTSWLAPALANLGKAYCCNGKLRHGLTAYRRAAGRFRAAQRAAAAAECERVASRIRARLDQQAAPPGSKKRN
jgi:tetratricopeptide (TPR) repeat protein